MHPHVPRLSVLVMLFALVSGPAGFEARRAAAQDASSNPALSGDANALPSPDLRVMSFNIRYNNPNDGEDAWPHRADGVADLILRHGADVVGLQEALPGQLADLDERLPGFDRVGISRGGERTKDEYSAILYRTEAVRPVEHGTFWLSESPDDTASTGWDAALPRIATWARFRLAGGGEGDAAGAGGRGEASVKPADSDAASPDFLHLNTHFDHRGERARLESARLIRRWLGEHAGDLPVIVTGDFNALPDSPPVRILTASGDGITLQDALSASVLPHEGPLSTWNGFEAVEPDRRIDFVFVAQGVQVLRHAILPDRLQAPAESDPAIHVGRFPSDHLPVLAEISFVPPRGR